MEQLIALNTRLSELVKNYERAHTWSDPWVEAVALDEIRKVIIAISDCERGIWSARQSAIIRCEKESDFVKIAVDGFDKVMNQIKERNKEAWGAELPESAVPHA